MARKTRLERLADEFGVDPKTVVEKLGQMPGARRSRPSTDLDPDKAPPDWAAYHQVVEAAKIDVGPSLRTPRTDPPNACKKCGSASTDGKCVSGCDGLLARVIPQAIGRGRRSR